MKRRIFGKGDVRPGSPADWSSGKGLLVIFLAAQSYHQRYRWQYPLAYGKAPFFILSISSNKTGGSFADSFVARGRVTGARKITAMPLAATDTHGDQRVLAAGALFIRTALVAMKAPEQPTGWPRAMAPPLGWSDRIETEARVTAMAWAAKASLTDDVHLIEGQAGLLRPAWSPGSGLRP